MTDRASEQRTILENEMIFGVKRRERMAWSVAIGGVLIGVGGIATALLMLPLKETQAFLTIVDHDTGIAERAVQIKRAGIEHADAVKQSLLFNYVMDRETYDVNDNEDRILKVYRQSTGTAQEQLRALWSEGHENYPPEIYGERGRVTVEVLSINAIDNNTAQVRFTKTYSQPGEDDRIGNFYATINYQFVPSQQSAVELVWENPFGFLVNSYRITAESMEAQEGGAE